MLVYCAEAGHWLHNIYNWKLGEREMIVYSAEMSQIDLVFQNKLQIPKFNILFSFYSSQSTEKYLPFAKSLLIDSGAFSLQSRKINQKEADKYFKKYLKFVEENHTNPLIKGFFELDIDQKVGYDNVLQYRKELLEITDKIIPVWHKQYGVNEFKKMSYDYDYISLSCVNDRSIKPEAYPRFVAFAHKNNCKIHGLGMLRPKILNKVPFDSVDGTSWFRTARYGKKDNKKVDSKYITNNQYELTFIDLMEHIRFQEKMYRKWRFYHND